MTPGNPSDAPTPPPGEAPSTGPLARLDRFMTDSPWHAYIVPFFVWIVCLAGLTFLSDDYPWAYPAIYVFSILAVGGLLWRYRKLTPELNIKFHWLAIPTGVGLLFAWIYLGFLSTALVPWFEPAADAEENLIPTWFETVRTEQGPAFFWLCMSLKFVGMVIIVPLFEELFTRGLLLRAFYDRKRSMLGITQVASDLALVGERIAATDYGKKANAAGPVLTDQLRSTPIGAITVFSVTLSTLIFMVNHSPRDYLGCIACGIVWCGLLYWTNRGLVASWKAGELPEGTVDPAASTRKPALGLGPIVWSHAITNAALWGWTLYRDYFTDTPDWRFL
ncbi:MAG: hypothetical protein AAF078_06575 [Planctomycetota bacterium]